MEELLTVQQVAELLGMHEGAVRKAILAGRINAHKLSARVLVVTRAEVERYRVERTPRGRPRKSPPPS